MAGHESIGNSGEDLNERWWDRAKVMGRAVLERMVTWPAPGSAKDLELKRRFWGEDSFDEENE
jgi:hypothetical protein